MCCRLSISPLDPDVAKSILAVGQFHPVNGNYWQRNIPEEGTEVGAQLRPDSNLLQLNIQPAVSTYLQHAEKRLAASVYFEIAAKYAEKVNGTIVQYANVTGCLDPLRTERRLAAYPHEPLLFVHVCPGFQELFGDA